MKFRTTLILLGLVLGLLVFLILYTLRRPGAAEYEANLGLIFPTTEVGGRLSERVVQLRIRRGDNSIFLARPAPASQDWRMTQPIAALADPDAISSILATLESLKPLRTLGRNERPEALLEYGLAPPEGEIHFAPSAGRSYALGLGALAADGKSVYAFRSEGPLLDVFILPRAIYDMAQMQVADLREKRLLRFDPAKADRLTLRLGEPPATLELAKSFRGWEIVAPFDDLAEAAEVDRVLRSLSERSLKKESFSDRAPRDCGLEGAPALVTVHEGEPSATLRIGQGSDGKWYGSRDGDPGVFLIGDAFIAALPRTLDAMRAMPFAPDEVTALTVSGPIPIKLERKEADWRLASSDKAADAERVRLFLRRLSDLEVKERVDRPTPEQLAQDGLEPPRLALSVETPRGLWELRFGANVLGSTLVYARRGNSGPVLTVPDTIVEMLAEGEKTFTARIVALDLRNEKPSSIRIVTSERTIRMVREGKAWTLQEPAGALDQDAVNALLLDLALVETLEALPKPPYLSDYGLDTPQATVTISVEGPPSAERKLLVGSRRAGGGVYAMNQNEDMVFVLDDSILESLRREFLQK